MSGQENFLRKLDADLTAALVACDMGDAATYTPTGASPTPVTCSVLVDHGVQFFGDDPSGIVGVRTVIRFQSSEIATPVRGATLAVGSRTYTLDKEIDRERGISSRWVVVE